MNDLGNICGIRIIGSDLIAETARKQYRFPRGKGKRIQKKFRKDSANWRDTIPVYFFNNQYMVNSKNVQKFALINAG